MARKRKPAQLQIFDPAVMPTADNNIDLYWNRFLPTVNKLLKEHDSICETWWRSRYSDFLTNGNHAHKDRKEWEYRDLGFQLWEEVWRKYKSTMTKGFKN